MSLTPFPSEAPYRVDQVMTQPGPMLALAIVQILLAAAMSRWPRPRPWWSAAVPFLAITTVFFALANWGTSDITRFNHFMASDPGRVLEEPLWLALAPVIMALPYGMASVQGLAAAAYALAPMLLSRLWNAARWGGWWALLVIWSPLLRNFLQNGVTRQALATILLVPVLVRMAGWGRPPWLVVGASVVASALCHASLPGTLLLALMPALLSPAVRPLPAWARRRGWWIGAALLVLLVVLLLGPLVADKLEFYLLKSSYFNSYALKGAVFWMEAASLITVLLTCWRARLGPAALGRCHDSRTLLLYTLLLAGVQLTVALEVMGPITSRFLDPIGLFWMLSLMAWTRRHGCPWALIPVLLVSGVYFIDDRILFSGSIRCHVDDQFLCLPDRWPWQVTH